MWAVKSKSRQLKYGSKVKKYIQTTQEDIRIQLR